MKNDETKNTKKWRTEEHEEYKKKNGQTWQNIRNTNSKANSKKEIEKWKMGRTERGIKRIEK